jgi:hypothetical protein
MQKADMTEESSEPSAIIWLGEVTDIFDKLKP